MKKILLVVLAAAVAAGLVTALVFIASGAPGRLARTVDATVGASAPPQNATAQPATVGASAPPQNATAQPATPTPLAPGALTPTPTAPRPSPVGDGTGGPVFRGSSAPASVSCPVPGEGPVGGVDVSPGVDLTWSSSGAETAFVGVDTADAEAQPYSEVAASGSVSVPFACPAASHTYTITLVGRGGSRSTTFTVENTGYRG
ncbi:hypothetical protein [Subtercola boreus]|uniref:Ig-like domain-containing protein n=1 Tax=Subtercola boreus TaxID=120213 RepID=A0A3E0W8D7_9MICO|nr:hypothetical protein [Subtercola boreus]RFA19463.1 hypothetical protein B7R24_12555 [Subtercola boreus]RFA19724.1 hypothetical protein B7R23_12535 [Subtercola boreus]RFA26090.1 hypothetical protein B7R25_12655 [Subtercola boreus]